jgi:hypothetical protein
MSLLYSQNLLNDAFTYSSYRQSLDEELMQNVQDEAIQKMRGYTEKNVAIMNTYDDICKVSGSLKAALETAPAAIWLVLTEGWCGDAAFNVPMMAAIERAMPDKVQLRLLYRDQNLDIIDAHLTNGGRSIPKLIVLDHSFNELGSWGPQPKGLQQEMKTWKSEGLELKQIIPKVREWYDKDATQSVQHELEELVKSYS